MFLGTLDVLVEGQENIVLKNGFYIGYLMGTPELSDDNENITIFPNPSSGLFNLTISDQFINSELTITDIRGRRIYYQDKILTPSTQINLSPYQKGIYFINVNTATKNIVKKVALIESAE